MHTQIATSSVLFAAAHCQPHDFLTLTALGVALGAVNVQAKGNLVAPTIAHVLYNASIIVAILVGGDTS